MDPETRESRAGKNKWNWRLEFGGISSRCSGIEPALLPASSHGGTRDSGADRSHVTATKKETKLKIKYLEGLEDLLYTQLVTQWSASALRSAWLHSSSGFFHISINFRNPFVYIDVSLQLLPSFRLALVGFVLVLGDCSVLLMSSCFLPTESVEYIVNCNS